MEWVICPEHRIPGKRDRQCVPRQHTRLYDKTYSLNDAASLQYLNAAKETYVIVIEDSKEQLLAVGSPFESPNEFLDHFKMSFADASSSLGTEKQLNINGNPAIQVEITKPFKDYNVYYLITVIEGDKHFYKMLAWTIESYKEQYQDDFKKVASSFRDNSEFRTYPLTNWIAYLLARYWYPVICKCITIHHSNCPGVSLSNSLE